MEGISVFHGKFAHPDQTGSRPCFIAEFGLYLIDHKRIFAVGLAVIPYQLNGGFFVRHAENQGAPAPVVEAGHFHADAFITARFLPERRRHNNWELYFLPVNRVHFFAQNLFYFSRNPFQRHIGRKNPVCHRFQITAANHKGVAFNKTVRRPFFKSVSHQFF